ncbi:hypothetical protein [Methylobacterium organophilum]|uniref:Uncharacterized protein n=1 Tax=Methylobacterium organophilum TaxID=410 RepID=A0ABQ4T616_METOR|nr:hypothetical protein [Methylobacterium organophilum]GJE26758.1 hypothetical protein LKMONMHP_1609 [Methylobacterium organophilum]
MRGSSGASPALCLTGVPKSFDGFAICAGVEYRLAQSFTVGYGF